MTRRLLLMVGLLGMLVAAERSAWGQLAGQGGSSFPGLFGQRSLGTTFQPRSPTFGGRGFSGTPLQNIGTTQFFGAQGSMLETRQGGEFVGRGASEAFVGRGAEGDGVARGLRGLTGALQNELEVRQQSRRDWNRRRQREAAAQGGQPKAAPPLPPVYRVGFSYAAPSTEAVQSKVADVMARLPAGKVEVVIEGRTAILRGSVPTLAELRTAVHLAMLEPAVASVRSEVRIEPPQQPDALPPLGPTSSTEMPVSPLASTEASRWTTESVLAPPLSAP